MSVFTSAWAVFSAGRKAGLRVAMGDAIPEEHGSCEHEHVNVFVLFS